MNHSKQKRFITDLLEGLPSIVFILLWRQSGDLEAAGWAGSLAALCVLGLMLYLKTKPHPVLVGVNIHILLASPVIVGLFRFGDIEVARFLSAHAYPAVLLTVLLTGIWQTLFSSKRFSALDDVSDAVQLRFSLALMVVCALGAVWALATPGSSFVPVVGTLTALIVGRNFLQARFSDKNGTGSLVVAGGAASHDRAGSADLAV